MPVRPAPFPPVCRTEATTSSGRLSPLWKPYWGHDPAAQILHFHGPKFQVIRYLLGEGPETLVHDIWRDLFERAPDAYRRYLAEARALVPELDTD